MKRWAMPHRVPKMVGSQWRVLTKHGPLEEGVAVHSSIPAARTPWRMKSREDMTPRSWAPQVRGVQYAIGEEWREVLGWCKSNCGFSLWNSAVWYWNTFLNKCFMLHIILMCISCFMFFANDLLLAILYLFLDYRNDVRQNTNSSDFLNLSLKWVVKQQRQLTTSTMHLAQELLMNIQWGWFKKFCKDDESLEEEETSGQPSEFDNDQLRPMNQLRPTEQYEKEERYDTEIWTHQVSRCPIRYWRRTEKQLQKEWRGWAEVEMMPRCGCDWWWK